MEVKQIINIMPDDKFLDYYISMSENFIPGLSSYLIFTNSDKLKYITSSNTDIELFQDTEQSYLDVIPRIKDTSVLVFHSFNLRQHNFILSASIKAKKVWLFWGFDGYGTLPEARFIRWRSHYAMWSPSLINLAKFIYRRIALSFTAQDNKTARRIIKEMDYCATWVTNDFLLAKRFNTQISHLSYIYYSRELMNLDDFCVQQPNSGRLFLGNSANPSNNHVEALHYLSQIKYGGVIYCPLSYGGNAEYVRNVSIIGERLFGKRFNPLTSFMPLSEYHDIVNSCGIVWMNHKRQQAAGNILIAFLTQKIVIMDKHNPMNDSFREWGLTFYSKKILRSLTKISESAISENREVIKKRLTINANKPFFEKIRSYTVT